MNGFIYGKPNISPSQLSLISKGQAEYCDLYYEKKVIITRTDNTKRDASKLYLKPELTQIADANFYAGEHITESNLEKKNKTGDVLITGRQMYDMGKRGQKHLKNATFLYCIKSNNPSNLFARSLRGFCIYH